MDDELDTFTGDHAYLEQTPSRIGADQHDAIVKHDDADGVAMSMEHVVVAETPCLRPYARISGSMLLST